MSFKIDSCPPPASSRNWCFLRKGWKFSEKCAVVARETHPIGSKNCRLAQHISCRVEVYSLYSPCPALLYEFREFGGVPMTHQILLFALNDVTKVFLSPSMTSLRFVEPSSTRGAEPLYQQPGFFTTQNTPLIFRWFTFLKSHCSQYSHYKNIIFHKIHNFKVSFFTKFIF